MNNFYRGLSHGLNFALWPLQRKIVIGLLLPALLEIALVVVGVVVFRGVTIDKNAKLILPTGPGLGVTDSTN